ncbi:MAG TPA: GGDEF domain-containing protein, partial [Planctomycetota bacterium]|nr:GGDEF domain-containing protein [Planctomycetota bacterium]
RQTDLLARLGGDEFAVILPEADAAGAHALMTRVRNRLVQLYGTENWPVSVSIGAVTFHQFPNSTDEIIHAADLLMYSVKSDGKNGLRVETWPTAAKSRTRSGRAQRVSRAISSSARPEPSNLSDSAELPPLRTRHDTTSGRQNPPTL